MTLSRTVLMATSHSYGVALFFATSTLGVRLTPQPIFTQNGLMRVDSRKDVPFAVKKKHNVF